MPQIYGMGNLSQQYAAKVKYGMEQGRKERENYYAARQPEILMDKANKAAAAEAEKERQYEAEQRAAAFSRAESFAKGILERYAQGAGAGPSDEAVTAQQALEQTISERGSEAQSELSSLLAKRGIFRSGAGAAAAAKLQGETEADVAKSRAEFTAQENERKRKEREAAISQAIQAFQTASVL